MKTYYHVRPRYTAGSPAMVDEATARRVAVEERVAHQHALQGAYGLAEQGRARDQGLGPAPDPHGVRRGIAESTEEHAGHWLVRDLLTDEIHQRWFHGSKPRVCLRCQGAHERAENERLK